MLLLGGAIFLELAGSVLFLANYSAGAYMLVCLCICSALSFSCPSLPLSGHSRHLPKIASSDRRALQYSQPVVTCSSCSQHL